MAMSIARVRCSGLSKDVLSSGWSGEGVTGCPWGKSHGGRATKRTPRKAMKLQRASFQVNGSCNQRKHTIAVMVGIRKVITVASEISSQDKESVEEGG